MGNASTEQSFVEDILFLKIFRLCVGFLKADQLKSRLDFSEHHKVRHPEEKRMHVSIVSIPATACIDFKNTFSTKPHSPV